MCTFFERLRDSARVSGSRLSVGLDPEPDRIDGGLKGAVGRCNAVIEATRGIACAYKPNVAFWERYGPDGWRALADVRAAIGKDTPVILDAKRADVPHTMAAYAAAIFEALDLDAATVHAWHGADSLAAFTGYADRGTYVVCHSSNPGRHDVQHLDCSGEPAYMHVAALASGLGHNVGLVVGATDPHVASRVRERFGSIPFLMPGVGRQGGDLEATVRGAATPDEASCLVHVSGSILYSDDPADTAESYRDRINAALAD